MYTYDHRNEMILHGKKHYKHGQTTNKKLGKKAAAYMIKDTPCNAQRVFLNQKEYKHPLPRGQRT